MVYLQFSMIGFLLLFSAGCAVNDRGLVSVHYFENATSYLLTQESWGGYLTTRSSDGGLTLGHAMRILIYPKPGNKPGSTSHELLQDSAAKPFNKEVDAKDVDLTGVLPYAWIEKNQGIIFHANPVKTGLSIGMESRSVISLPNDFDGILELSNGKDGKYKAGIAESRKNN